MAPYLVAIFLYLHECNNAIKYSFYFYLHVQCTSKFYLSLFNFHPINFVLKGPVVILFLRKSKRNRVCLSIKQSQGRVKQMPAITDNHGSSSACSIEFWGKT